jgi:hypothetical protein
MLLQLLSFRKSVRKIGLVVNDYEGKLQLFDEYPLTYYNVALMSRG